MSIIFGSSIRYAYKQIKHSSDSKPTLFSLLRKDNSLELPPRMPITDLLLWEALEKKDRMINPGTFFQIEGANRLDVHYLQKDPFTLEQVNVSQKFLKSNTKEPETLLVRKPTRVKG